MAASPDLAEPTVSEPATAVTTLRVFRAGGVDLAAIRGALGHPAWLGEPVIRDDTPPGMTTFLTDLVLPLPPDGRLLSLRKAAFVELGLVQDRTDGLEVEIGWRSASLAPLFPVFAGRLAARAGGLSIEGHYAPPGGRLGLAADRALLSVAARGTARWFLNHLAAQARTIAGG